MMHLYSSARADLLADRLAEMLAAAPPDPMTTEWVAVASQGMRRWLLLQLARRLGATTPQLGDGVAANVSLPFPGALRLQVLEADRGEDGPDPWEIERLVWTVLSVAEIHAGDPVLSAFIDVPDGASMYGKARRVADLFDRYHVHRPYMVQQWAANRDLNGLGRPLPEHHAWQPHLWRLVRDHIGDASPPERMPRVLRALREGRLAVDLPQRITLFGLTSLPGGRSLLELCQALATQREVRLLLLEPTHFNGDALLAAAGPGPSGDQRSRADDTSAALAAHPLLRSWGRPHREASLLLADTLGTDPSGLHCIADPAQTEWSGTVLGRLQQEIARNRPPGGSLRVRRPDRSLQFHACHGATRQVEVLRDAILHLLATPELDLVEDDIVVLCPALDRFAPLVEAVFGPSADFATAGAADASGSPLLRYRIADRSVRDANPVLSAMTALIDLVGGRFDATSVLDFVSLAPVRHRFGLDDDDMATISDWVESAGVRWGLTPDHRPQFGVPSTIGTNTWRSALDRLLLGSAISDDRPGLAIGDVAVVGVEGGDVELLGDVAELLWRLTEMADEFSRSHTIHEWVALLREQAGELFSTPAELAWQLHALFQALADVDSSAMAEPGATKVPLGAIDLRRIFEDRLLNAPGRPDFFRGGITVTTLKPLRGIPYRVVCLLGADESAFGAGSADGDDLAALAPLVGDPDARADDRQSLLEALLAADDYLVVTREGHDVRTNQAVPRAVVLEELRDAALATIHPDDRAAFAPHLEIDHPRQAFDERCFIAGALVADVPWGFDRHDLAGAEARRHRTAASPPFITAPLVAHPNNVVELADLQSFVKHPVAWFVSQRLEARVPRSEEARITLLPVAPTPLEKWKLGDALLAARRAGMTSEEWARIERRRGTIPPGSLGEQLIGTVTAAVDQLLQTTLTLGIAAGAGSAVPIDIMLPDGSRIVGEVRTHLGPPVRGPARVTYSTPKLDYRVSAWLDLMALVANHPDIKWRSVVVSRTGQVRRPVDVVEFTPRDSGAGIAATAIAALALVVECFRQGNDEPIPLFPAFSEKVYLDTHRPADWAGDFGRCETAHPATGLAYGGYEFEDVMALPARMDDPAGPGGRVERLAHAFFGTMESSATAEMVP